MKKLKLDLKELKVNSFEVQVKIKGKGTVIGNLPTDAGPSCDVACLPTRHPVLCDTNAPTNCAGATCD